MSIDGIRRGLAAAQARDGKVDAKALDKVILEARDGGGLDEGERAELLRHSDGFDEGTRARLSQHLVASGQKAAFANLELGGRVTGVEGRFAQLQTEVPGLKAKLGLFDNTFSLEGKAKASGKIDLAIDGRRFSIDVQKGDRPATLLAKLQTQLPRELASQLFDGSVRPYEAERFEGAPARGNSNAARITFYKPAELGLRPGEKPLRVVVTGYGPFMGITDNPSDRMARKISELGASGAIIEYRRLDVTHDAVKGFVAEMRNSPPDVILSMGVSYRAQVEERPENRVGGGEDGAGRPIQPGIIRTGGEAELQTDLPVDAINQALDARFGASREVGSSAADPSYSPDRSAYLCNFLGYNLADAFGKSSGTAAGFVHISERTPPEQMSVLLQAVVSRQLEVRRQAAISLPPS